MTPVQRPRSQAQALARLRVKVEKATAANEALDEAVLEARAAGATLRAIGNVLGHSHVAVHQRLRKLDALNDAIAEGLADLDAGRTAEYDPS